MIRFTSGSLFKVISLCKSGRRYSDEKIAEMLFPNVEYTTNYIGHVKDCTKNLPDEITQYMSDTDQEEIIDTLNRAVRKVFLTVISSEKQPILIAAIQKILEEDLSIADSTQVGYLPSYTKGNMKNATTVEPIEFIANALFSVCNQQNNQDGKEDIKNINPSFLEKLKSSAQRITLQIVQKPEEKIVINAIQPAVAGDDYSIIYEDPKGDHSVGIYEKFTHKWRIKNTGTIPWENRYLTLQNKGEIRVKAIQDQFDIPALKPGDKVFVPLLADNNDGENTTSESIILYCTRNGINSIGVRTSDGFVVKKGSIISQKITKSCPDYVLKKRTQHKNIIDANNMLTEDILFNTPSGAYLMQGLEIVARHPIQEVRPDKIL